MTELKRFRVKEVWRYTGWAYVTAEDAAKATKKLDDGDGEFDEHGAEPEYVKTIGDVEEVR